MQVVLYELLPVMGLSIYVLLCIVNLAYCQDDHRSSVEASMDSASETNEANAPFDDLENETIRNEELLEAVEIGLAYDRRLTEIEQQIMKLDLTVQQRTSAYQLSSYVGSDPEITNISRNALIALKVGETLIKRSM